MSPRRNRPKRRGPKPPDDDDRPFDAGIVVGTPPGWHARVITAERAEKVYKCPGCNNDIHPGTAHVVAWREGEDADRRHWHTGCWNTFRRTGRV